jgi:glycine dehydrogenase subunit 1
MASGGPSFGFLCARMEMVRQMPGRIVGRTVDRDGRTGYTLTLQAREQHIRRAKATSNICTNQGLLVTAATIHLAIMGAQGLAAVANSCRANTAALTAALTAIDGVRRRFAGPVFHEDVLQLPRPPQVVLDALASRGIAGGHALGTHYPELADCLLVCATEKRTPAEIERYADVLREVLTT